MSVTPRALLKENCGCYDRDAMPVTFNSRVFYPASLIRNAFL